MRARLLALAVAVVACDLPDRDNAFDPSGAPIARVTVSPPTGGASTDFVFDASASTNPLAASGTSNGLRFEWDIGADGTIDETTTSPIYTRRFALGSNGAPQSYSVRLTLMSVQGYRSREPALAAISLSNRAPTVDVGDDLVVSELPGLRVDLDACGEQSPCPTVDPDGDPITYSWTQITGPAVENLVGADTARPSFTVPAASPRAPLVFRLVVSDGFESSSDFVQVNRISHVWVKTSGPTRIHRFFFRSPVKATNPPLKPSVPTDEYYIHSIASIFALPATETWVGYSDADWQGGPPTPGSVAVVRLGADLQELGRWTLDTGTSIDRFFEGIVSIAPLGDATLPTFPAGCAAVREDGAGSGFARLFSDSSSALEIVTAPGTRPVGVFPAGDQNNPATDCWTVDSRGGIGLLADSPPYWSQVVAPSTDPNRFVTAAIGSGENLWIAELDNNGTGFPTFDDDITRLRRYSPLQGLTAEVVLPTGFRVFALASWKDADHVWAYGKQGLKLVAADGSAVDYPIDVPQTPNASAISNPIVSDPVADILWIADYATSNLRRFQVSEAGSQLVETDVLPVEELNDAGGATSYSLLGVVERKAGDLVVVAPNGASLVKVIARLPLHLRGGAPVPADFDVAGRMVVDPRTGHLWISGTYLLGANPGAKGLARITHTGARLVDLPELPDGPIDVADDGTIWRGEVTDLVHRGRDGMEVQRIPVGPEKVDSVSVEGTTLCATTGEYDPTPPYSNTGRALRLDLTSGSLQPLTLLLSGTAFVAQSALARANGDCWFLAKRSVDMRCCVPVFSNCTAEQPMRILKFPAGSSTASVVTVADDDLIAGNPPSPDLRDWELCPTQLVSDPAGGVWTTTFDYERSRITQYDASGVELSRIGGTFDSEGVQLENSGSLHVEICESCASADERRLFHAGSFTVYVRDRHGSVLETRSLPVGQPSGIQVVK